MTTKVLRGKSAPLPLRPPQNPHGMTLSLIRMQLFEILIDKQKMVTKHSCSRQTARYSACENTATCVCTHITTLSNLIFSWFLPTPTSTSILSRQIPSLSQFVSHQLAESSRSFRQPFTASQIDPYHRRHMVL